MTDDDRVAAALARGRGEARGTEAHYQKAIEDRAVLAEAYEKLSELHERRARGEREANAHCVRLAAEVERLRAKLNCTCGLLRSVTTRTEHAMSCREYVGPLTHKWINTSYNVTFGGTDYRCSCGGWFRQGGIAGHGDGTEEAEPICPHASETWRGPREQEAER